MNLASRPSSHRLSTYALLAMPLYGLTLAGGPSYAPEAGASDTQYWEVTHTLSFVEVAVELASGEEVQIPEIEMETTRARSLTMDQVHEAAKDGRPTSLRRTFVELEDDMEGRFVIEEESVAEALDAEVEGALADQSVRLSWSDENEEWSVIFVDADGGPTDGPTSDLEGLIADAHLGGLLTDLEEPSEGARWTADAAVLAALVCPGGKTHTGVNVNSAAERGAEPALAGLDPLLGMELWELFGDEAAKLEGGIECKVASMSGDAMVMALDVDVTSTCDVSEKLAEWVESAELPFTGEVIEGEATLQAEGEGSVTWDLKTGLPAKVELELELSYTMEREASFAIPGQGEDEISTKVELAGTLRSTMSAE